VSAELERRLERVEGLIEQLEAEADPASRAAARELLQAVMELHAAGLARIVALTREAGAPGSKLLERFSHDRQVQVLLQLHDMEIEPPQPLVVLERHHTNGHAGARSSS